MRLGNGMRDGLFIDLWLTDIVEGVWDGMGFVY